MLKHEDVVETDLSTIQEQLDQMNKTLKRIEELLEIQTGEKTEKKRTGKTW